MNPPYKQKAYVKYRKRKTWQRAISKGHCPVCSMLLISTFHINCRYLDKEDKTTPF